MRSLQLHDIELRQGTEKPIYLLVLTFKGGRKKTNVSIRGNDLDQLKWWAEWKITNVLTDGEVNMDVQ